jgi:hypothetical protein
MRQIINIVLTIILGIGLALFFTSCETGDEPTPVKVECVTGQFGEIQDFFDTCDQRIEIKNQKGEIVAYFDYAELDEITVNYADDNALDVQKTDGVRYSFYFIQGELVISIYSETIGL